jgi:hypothetical protein
MATNRNKPRLAVTIPPEYATWLKRMASKRMISLSAAVQEALRPAFEARHAK